MAITGAFGHRRIYCRAKRDDPHRNVLLLCFFAGEQKPVLDSLGKGHGRLRAPAPTIEAFNAIRAVSDIICFGLPVGQEDHMACCRLIRRYIRILTRKDAAW